jgi:hypothetical protein
MQSNVEKSFDGAIPGENYTSDTRNYPWHRPPDLTDLDEIVEDVIITISERTVLPTVMSQLALGATVSGITDYLIMSKISEGKFAIDMGLLAAGPVARFIQIMADDFDVDYEMGLEEEFKVLTPNIIKSLKQAVEEEEEAVVEEPAPEEPEEDLGFMARPEGAAPEEEQMSMLGQSDDEPLEEELDGV